MIEPPLDNAFWRFSLRVYAAPGVEAECLALQEAIGLDVNVLLFCAWLGAARRVALSPADLEAVMAHTKDWHEQVVRRLRRVRLFLKTLPAPRSGALRTQVKAAELASEQNEQAMLFAWAERRPREADENSPYDIVRRNVGLCLAAYGSAPDRVACSATRLVAAAIAYAPTR